MNEEKKVNKPARRRRSSRKLRRFNYTPIYKTEENNDISADSVENQGVPTEEQREDVRLPLKQQQQELIESSSESPSDPTEGSSEEQDEERIPTDPQMKLADVGSSLPEPVSAKLPCDDEEKTEPRIELESFSEYLVTEDTPQAEEQPSQKHVQTSNSRDFSEDDETSVEPDSSVKQTRTISIPPEIPPSDIVSDASEVSIPPDIPPSDIVSDASEVSSVDNSVLLDEESLLEDNTSSDLDKETEIEIPDLGIEASLVELEASENETLEMFQDTDGKTPANRSVEVSKQEKESQTRYTPVENREAYILDADVEELESESVNTEQGISELESEARNKIELSEDDLERAIEYELSLEEETIQELDQKDLIQSDELSEFIDSEGSLRQMDPENTAETGSIPPASPPRPTPPPSPPNIKAKRISGKPPPPPSTHAHPVASPPPIHNIDKHASGDEQKPTLRAVKGPRPWWEKFFSDDYLRSVMPLTQPQVNKQCDFIQESLNLDRGSTILDVGCGLGLHAVELTTRGYLVVGLDLSLPMITRAAEEAQYRGLKINFIHADIRQIEFEGSFDAVICMGTTFGFFDEESNFDVLNRLSGALRPGGKLLVDVVNRDFAIKLQPNLVWFQGDDCVCMEESEFNYITSRLHVKRTMMQEDGRQSDAEYSIRLYSLHELINLMYRTGFNVLEVSGQEATRCVFFGVNAPRILLLAERIAQTPRISGYPSKGRDTQNTRTKNNNKN